MLINDFYTFHDSLCGANEFSCRVVFNDAHAIFKGHFPGQPVVPGVCMIEMARELLQAQTGKRLMLHDARNVKFLQFITPAMQPLAHITWTESGAILNLTAVLKHEGTVLFKLDASFGAMNF